MHLSYNADFKWVLGPLLSWRESRAARLQSSSPHSRVQMYKLYPTEGCISSPPMLQIVDRRMIVSSCMHATPADTLHGVCSTASAVSCRWKHSARGVARRPCSTGRRRAYPLKAYSRLRSIVSRKARQGQGSSAPVRLLPAACSMTRHRCWSVSSTYPE